MTTKQLLGQKRLVVLEGACARPRRAVAGAIYVEVGKQIKFDAAALDDFDVEGCQPVHYDLLLICAAVEFADRRWERPRSWGRKLHLIIPTIATGIWQNPDVVAKLCAALRHLTGDQWSFDFKAAGNKAPIGERQIPLGFANSKKFAVPYSEGLDSRAVSALSGTEDDALCVRVSNNRQKRRPGENFFNQVPFKVLGHTSNESSFRSRGFQFGVVTAIAAHLFGISRIIVPESGQGALGPVLLPLYNIYRDYRNHPSFFRKMERFLSAALDHSVEFDQPRMWSTKGQTLRRFLTQTGRPQADLTSTTSCWQKRTVVNFGGKRRQCGLCAACLLRRMSMHAAEINEASDTYVIADLRASSVAQALAVVADQSQRRIMVEYGSVGTRHLAQLAALADRPDEELRAETSEIAEATNLPYDAALENMRDLLLEHAREWRSFIDGLGTESFMVGWLDGGRYG